ncbi:MAG: hypothetical protein AB1631_00540 [Acidobacteriota bacterium]
MDIEHTMQFILEQQAKFSADIDVLKEAVSRQGENINRLNVAIDEVIQSQKKMNEYLGQLTEVVASLADSVSTVEAHEQTTSESLIKLTEVITGNERTTSRNLTQLTEMVGGLADSVSDLKAQAESDRAEIRDAIGKLVSSEEETRRFAIEIAQLVKQHEARISELENK